MIAIVVISLILIVILIASALIYSYLQQIEVLKQQTLAQAISGTAKVLQLKHDGFNYQKGTIRKIGLRLTLEIQHPQFPVYQTDSLWLVDEILIPQVQPGQSLPVKINSIDSTRVYPNASGMEFSGWQLKRTH